MDLCAYERIDELEKIAKENNIEIPRLRGYRLMKDEEPVSKTEINEIKKEGEVSVVKRLCEADPFWCPTADWYTTSEYTDAIKNYFLIKNGSGEYVGIRWDRIHGRKRKILKFAIKKNNRNIQKQYGIWNKYAGRDDVLYIHSRMGGNNWKYYEEKQSILNQPWFLDRVDDYWDSTYCDFYAKIKV